MADTCRDKCPERPDRMYVLTVFMSVCTVGICKMITVKAPGQIVISGYMLVAALFMLVFQDLLMLYEGIEVIIPLIPSDS